MTSPADPANDSSDWILTSNINSRKLLVSIDYDPPIVAQNVAVIRFDTVELALVEVTVYGKFYSVLVYKEKSTSYYNWECVV